MVRLRTYSPVLLAAALALPSLSAQATSWVPTATQAVTTLVSATDLGHANVSGLMTVRLGLAIQNKPALDQYIQSISKPSSALYGQSLSPDQFAAQFGPSQSTFIQWPLSHTWWLQLLSLYCSTMFAARDVPALSRSVTVVLVVLVVWSVAASLSPKVSRYTCEL